MRGDDDDNAQGDSTSGGPLAEGLGETVDPGVSSSTSDAYGDVGDSYGDDSYGDGSDTTTDDTTTDDSYGDDTTTDDSYGDDTTTDDSYATTTTDDSYGDDTTTDDSYGDDTEVDDTYGDGAGTEDGTDVPDEPTGEGDDVDVTVDGGLDGTELLTESESPLDGIRYVLDELHDALFGDDEATVGEAVGSGLDTDPTDLPTDTDLDLNGDGVVDTADLHELESGFDLDAG